MTYETIISEVCLNMGWKGTTDQYITPVKNAIYRALMELTGDSGTIRGDVYFPINENQMDYIMPSDFHIPIGVILEAGGVAYDSVEVEYDELLKYSLTIGDEQINDRYLGKILFAFRKTSSQPTLTIYPAVSGVARIGYEALVNEDMDITASKTPPIPRRFHLNLIDGASYYLSKRELASAISKGDLNLIASYTLLMNEHKKTFEEGKRNYAVYGKKRSTPQVSVPFLWYDNPDEYY
jgi:hypothetical protein